MYIRKWIFCLKWVMFLQSCTTFLYLCSPLNENTAIPNESHFRVVLFWISIGNVYRKWCCYYIHISYDAILGCSIYRQLCLNNTYN
jgi:hypothetical protein